MFEKVNPSHPDKIADRIAGRLVDIAYTRSEGGWLKSNPRIAVEVLIGHGTATVIIETSCTRAELSPTDVIATVRSLAPSIPPENMFIKIVPQDPHLADNQLISPKCGDNGIFKGMPITREQRTLTALAATIYGKYHTDGKYIIDGHEAGGLLNAPLTICQSQAYHADIYMLVQQMEHDAKALFYNTCINPLGPWTGGIDADSGATNRKLGSDMGDAVTGGGLHGKDLSKADVSVNIVAHMLAQKYGPVWATCAIGDEQVTFHSGQLPDELPAFETMSYTDIVERARMYIYTQFGSFEKFAEWGLIAPPAGSL